MLRYTTSGCMEILALLCQSREVAIAVKGKFNGFLSFLIAQEDSACLSPVSQALAAEKGEKQSPEMFGMMLYATLSLVEKVAPKIRQKHVSELHVIIVGKTSARRSESPLWLVSVLGENTASLLA